MADDWDSDAQRRKFAEERSHKDAAVSNETGRATAQAAILINGGAATAVLALLAKQDISPAVLRLVPWCLGGYAIGVLSGASMLFCSMLSLDAYGMYWRLVAQPDDPLINRKAKDFNARAYRLWHWVRAFFVLAMAAFLVSSFVLAWSLAGA
jgi:hypothetical protein